MKRLLLIGLIIGCFLKLSQGQNITEIEYFFDSDPGFGNASQLSFSPASQIEIERTIDISSLPSGIHSIFIRGKDEDNNWSLYSKKLVYIIEGFSSLPDIVQLEYFWDNDPGFNLGSQIEITAGSEIIKSVVINVSTISSGVHSLFVRAKDAFGNWSLYSKRNVFVVEGLSSLPDIVQLEYFWDNDPGFGLGTQIEITVGNDVTKDFMVDISMISPGVHSLFVRAKDAFGNWSLYSKHIVFVVEGFQAVPMIVEMEYFFDTDPGFGQATALSVPTPNDTLQAVYDISLTGLSIGDHYLYIRAKDEYDRWSLYTKDTVTIEDWKYLNVQAVLEGPYNGTEMVIEINSLGLLPLSQPFNVTPWNYSGQESVAEIPNADVVDWVLLELRDAQNAAGAGSGTLIERKAGFLLKNGNIVGINGINRLAFTTDISENLFIVVYHRNHLEMMSANALTVSGEIYSYDFTTDISKAYGDSEKNIGGTAVMFGGDINTDGSINDNDKMIWATETGTSGYLKSDTQLDGQVDNKDKNDLWLNNINEESQVPD